MVGPKPGRTLFLLDNAIFDSCRGEARLARLRSEVVKGDACVAPTHYSFYRSGDLVEYSAIAEVRLLRFLPATEGLVDGVEFQLGQPGRNLFIDRPVVVLGGDLLPFVCVKVFQILFRHLAGSTL